MVLDKFVLEAKFVDYVLTVIDYYLIALFNTLNDFVYSIRLSFMLDSAIRLSCRDILAVGRILIDCGRTIVS